MARVVVFHTSDLHDKLTPEIADRLRELKASVPDSLMLDSGDALRAGNIFWLPKEPAIDLMNSVPYDAMCMGNREYHFLRAGLMAKTSGAKFPILSANLRAAKADSPLPVEPWVVIERGGVKIGIVGLTIPCITERMMVKRLAQYYFARPLDAAKAVVPEVRQRCDLVIALTHLPAGADHDVASKVPGMDVIMAGHSHTIADPERVDDTTILRHGAWARHVGKVTIDVEHDHVTVTDELIPLVEA
jgi:2',3'-cyclic-nucleotide 2'-phosphodiesterase (5'-nucleotidase family)